MSHVCSRDVLSCQNMELDKHKYDLLLTIKELEKMGVKSCAQRIMLMCSSCIPILSAIGQSDVLYISLTFL